MRAAPASAPAPAPASTQLAMASAASPSATAPSSATLASANPYLAYTWKPSDSAGGAGSAVSAGSAVKPPALSLPSFSSNGRSFTLIPTIKTVYPTGEKPLVVVSFKCPTELIGVVPPPTAALHELVNAGLDGLNRTNLLSFNMQQVCE
jgi:hypothetical protein